jgi:putative flippase GtrA
MKERLRALLEKLEQGKLAPLVQFVKFGLVGVSNTAISYGIEMLGYYVILARTNWLERLRIVVVTTAAFMVSVLNSYYWNNRYVFRDAERKTIRDHLKALMKMAACYALTGLLLAPVLKVWIHERGAAYWLASLLTLVVTVPLNFALNKLWAFRRRKK